VGAWLSFLPKGIVRTNSPEVCPDEGDELFEYICQQFNQEHELMFGSQDEIDNTRFFVP
jgi:hypothetical protein